MGTENTPVLGLQALRSLYARLLIESFVPADDDLWRTVETYSPAELRVVDFTLQPGNISARVQARDSASMLVRFRAPVLLEEQWHRLCDVLSEHAYFASQLLAGRLPGEIAEIASSNDIPFIPRGALLVELDGEQLKTISPEIWVCLLHLGETLDGEPGLFCTFRGKSPQELIAELRKRRLKQTSERRRPTAITQLNYPTQELASESLERFWQIDPAVLSLSYTIKADELPASILKWLEPIPLSGLEDKIDYVVEEAYARIARLAQSFGLGL